MKYLSSGFLKQMSNISHESKYDKKFEDTKGVIRIRRS